MADHARRLGATLALAVAAGLLATVLSTPVAAQPEAEATGAVATEDSTFRVDDILPELRSSGGRLVARQRGVDAFTTIGVTASPLEGRVRAHLPSGWTRWFELHAHAGRTSDPVWVGDDADGWELELAAGATDVAVHLVRPTGIAAPVSAVRPEAETAAGGGEASFNPAPPINRREAWGAAPYRGPVRLNARITRGVVHHTVNSNTYSSAQVPSMLRSIQAFHQGGRGWPDIAYNFIVDRFGRIWEARDRSFEDPVRVSATSGTVIDTVTVAFLGDATSYTPSNATITAMGRLLGWKMRKHGRIPNRSNIVSHTDIGQTTCPGARLLGRMAAIENAAMRGNPAPGPFWDVRWTARNARAIDWAARAKIIPGYPDNTFRPGGRVTRADALVFVWRLAGKPSGTSHPFTDVPANAPYREALEWGSDTGVAKGASPTRFAPGRTITRQGMVDLLWRWQGRPDIPVDHGFADAGPRESLDWARAYGFVGGQNFRGSQATTRGIAARWLHRFRAFTDVGRGNVHRGAVDWARAHVIATGYRNHTFRPGQVVTRVAAARWVWRFLDRPAPGPVDATPGTDPLTRATAVTWLYEAAGSPAVTTPSDYTDIGAGEPHEAAAAWAQDFTLFPDINGPVFDADEPVTRGQFLRAMFRLAARPLAWDPAVTPPTTVRF